MSDIDWSIIDEVPESENDLRRLLSSREWRLNNLYHITTKNPDKPLMKFRMNEVQRKFHEERHTKNIILKARQLGFTTYIQIYILDSCLFRSYNTAGVIAHNKSDAQVFFENKIKFAYDMLGERQGDRYQKIQKQIKLSETTKSDSAGKLSFSNHSQIIVGVSLRSGTYRILHVSEYGKLSAKEPERAAEVKSGALNTVPPDGEVFIESTAEGRTGEFYDMVVQSRKLQDSGEPLTDMDYKFHFFAWYHDDNYKLEGDVLIPQDMKVYFDSLAQQGIHLTKEQKNWYVKKAAEQGDKMKQEYPSTPDECFEQSIKGAYFATQMRQLRHGKQICRVPIESHIPIHTFWDLGRDTTAIWFFQKVGMEHRFVDYYENSGEDMTFYINELRKRNDRGRPYLYGECYLPHDGSRKSISAKLSPQDILVRHGFGVVIVPRTPNKTLSIERARQVLPKCYFDVEKCAQGITHLDNYRKEFDEKHGTWKARPLHNEASHGADSFMTYADGYAFTPERYYEDNDDDYDDHGRNQVTGY